MAVPDAMRDGLTQVQRGMQYIEDRYGTPKVAQNAEVGCGTPPWGYAPVAGDAQPTGREDSGGSSGGLLGPPASSL